MPAARGAARARRRSTLPSGPASTANNYAHRFLSESAFAERQRRPGRYSFPTILMKDMKSVAKR